MVYICRSRLGAAFYFQYHSREIKGDYVMKTVFIEPNNVFSYRKYYYKLLDAVEERISEGYDNFIVGPNDFDKTTFRICRRIRHFHPDINIAAILLSDEEKENAAYYKATTIVYDFEYKHLGRRNLESHKRALRQCEAVIGYVNDENKHTVDAYAMRYARRNGLKTINIYDPTELYPF